MLQRMLERLGDMEETAVVEHNMTEEQFVRLERMLTRVGSLLCIIENFKEPRWLWKFLVEDNKRLAKQVITGRV